MIFERRRAAEGHVRREVGERGARGGRDELGAGDGRAGATAGHDVGGGHARVVLDVRGDLDAPLELRPSART